jgi:hypothetical protein
MYGSGLPTEIKQVLSEANTVLIALIDHIRMLDNDLIRLNQKINIVLMLKEQENDTFKKNIRNKHNNNNE